MSETERKIAIGKDLGLEGVGLQEFLSEERLAECERRKLDDERDKTRFERKIPVVEKEK